MVFEQIWHRLCGSPGCQIEHFLAPLDFYLARSAGRRSVRQGEAKLGRCRCRWSAIAGGSLLARRAGGAACYCPAATCYGGHSVQLNSCQSQLGEMSPLRIPLGILFFFFVSFHVKKHHPVMIKVPRLHHPRLSLLAAATLSSSSSSSCCTGSSQRRLPGSVTTRRKPIGYGICGKIVRARGTGDILDLNTSNRGWEEVECTGELKS